MHARVFDGNAVANEREQKLKERVATLGFSPRLLSIVFHQDPASLLYTRLKHEAAARVGIEFDQLDVSFTDPLTDLIVRIEVAGERADVHGLMIQKPSKRVWLKHMNTHTSDEFERWWEQLVAHIPPEKDVDCLTEYNLQKVHTGGWTLLPATVKGIVEVLSLATDQPSQGLHPDLSGKTALIIGKSRIVGLPLAAVLEQAGARVYLAGSRTVGLKTYMAEADIICSATGTPNLVSSADIKEGSIVIDVGSPSGDVDVAGIQEKASFVTPVPNGVGPMTVVSLFENMVNICI